ncbi:MAG: LPS assembly lipoprotein LptE [Granulosicoccus sp.]
MALFIAMIQVQACGFRPRGSVTELTDPGSIFVDASRDLSISGALNQALRDRAFTLADNRDEADILLRLTGEQEKRRIVSVQKTGRISELELSHAVNILIARATENSGPVYDPEKLANRVEVIREYTYDDRGVLGKENEARILREEMREELVRQIVLRTIASLAPATS